MDTDILKPDTGYLTVIERPHGSSSATPHTASKGGSSQGSSGGSADRSPPGETYHEPVSEGEEDDERDLQPAKDEDKRTGLSGKDLEEAIAYRERMLKEQRANERREENAKQRGDVQDRHDHDHAVDDEDADEARPLLRGRRLTNETGRSRALSIDPLAPSAAFDETLRDRLSEHERMNGHGNGHAHEQGAPPNGRGSSADDERLLERRWHAPDGIDRLERAIPASPDCLDLVVCSGPASPLCLAQRTRSEAGLPASSGGRANDINRYSPADQSAHHNQESTTDCEPI